MCFILELPKQNWYHSTSVTLCTFRVSRVYASMFGEPGSVLLCKREVLPRRCGSDARQSNRDLKYPIVSNRRAVREWEGLGARLLISQKWAG